MDQTAHAPACADGKAAEGRRGGRAAPAPAAAAPGGGAEEAESTDEPGSGTDSVETLSPCAVYCAEKILGNPFKILALLAALFGVVVWWAHELHEEKQQVAFIPHSTTGARILGDFPETADSQALHDVVVFWCKQCDLMQLPDFDKDRRAVQAQLTRSGLQEPHCRDLGWSSVDEGTTAGLRGLKYLSPDRTTSFVEYHSESRHCMQKIRHELQRDFYRTQGPLFVSLGGPEAVAGASMEAELRTMMKHALIAVPLSCVLLWLFVGNIFRVLSPVLCMIFAYWSGQATVGLIKRFCHGLNVNYNDSFVLFLDLALCVDYALFFWTRFVQERARADFQAALREALQTSGMVILISNFFVTVAYICTLCFPDLNLWGFRALYIEALSSCATCGFFSVVLTPALAAAFPALFDDGPSFLNAAHEAFWTHCPEPQRLWKPWAKAITSPPLMIVLPIAAYAGMAPFVLTIGSYEPSYDIQKQGSRLDTIEHKALEQFESHFSVGMLSPITLVLEAHDLQDDRLGQSMAALRAPHARAGAGAAAAAAGGGAVGGHEGGGTAAEAEAAAAAAAAAASSAAEAKSARHREIVQQRRQRRAAQRERRRATAAAEAAHRRSERNLTRSPSGALGGNISTAVLRTLRRAANATAGWRFWEPRAGREAGNGTQRPPKRLRSDGGPGGKLHGAKAPRGAKPKPLGPGGKRLAVERLLEEPSKHGGDLQVGGAQGLLHPHRVQPEPVPAGESASAGWRAWFKNSPLSDAAAAAAQVPVPAPPPPPILAVRQVEGYEEAMDVPSSKRAARVAAESRATAAAAKAMQRGEEGGMAAPLEVAAPVVSVWPSIAHSQDRGGDLASLLQRQLSVVKSESSFHKGGDSEQPPWLEQLGKPGILGKPGERITAAFRRLALNPSFGRAVCKLAEGIVNMTRGKRYEVKVSDMLSIWWLPSAVSDGSTGNYGCSVNAAKQAAAMLNSEGSSGDSSSLLARMPPMLQHSVSPDGNKVQLKLFTRFSPSSPEAAQLDFLIRDHLENTGRTVEIDGKQYALRLRHASAMANQVEANKQLAAAAPRIFGIFAAVAAVLITVTFRSAFLSVKLVLTVLAPILTTYGVAIAVYQLNMLGFLGLQPFSATGGLDFRMIYVTPGVLFGLAMDYDLFLFVRVYEHRQEGYDNTSAVRKALAETGPVITAAGILMAVSFFAILMSDTILFRTLGFIFFFGVSFDVFVVRTSIAPVFLCIGENLNYWPVVMPPATKSWK